MAVAETVDQAREDARWMDRALALAGQAASIGEVPVGAVVVLEGREVGAGFNAPISGSDPTAHAEIRAIRDAACRVGNYRLSGATLYVTIEPCTMCAGAIVHARISRLVYGATEPKAGAVESSAQILDSDAMNWRVATTGGVQAERCSEVISDFFAARRRAAKARRKCSAQAPRPSGP
ncbi:tRNA adenosine(34) deaminase TadA [Marinobacter nanhaiticus D15-8W]|uniref:tRNA-specific adenosine deaminase n=1 Tax=Marinobacter nanhaiticus D15-8W TaxID=626887 RepID=N6WS43_9GAMM|nr:tRNA adenosine(34) deaminase TadA [Marinobacter nanhaiticus]ENO14371.1 tRNA adenosine(34) deaminase TadA [Marinobacter nanhaiticus D15-8W]BES71760.1 tRNA adenosine(34) deaminase TadA [Marinobacter nanhaiticus D15-8W]